jgi:dynein heavy chain
MIFVRHGLMLVGYSYEAKIESYRVFATVLGYMKAHGEGEQITYYICLNLKSIYIGQLYG